MQILGRSGLLGVHCSVLESFEWVLQIFLGFLGMDFAPCIKSLSYKSEFGCRFLVFGWFSPYFLLGLLFVFGLGLKVLQVRFYSKCLMEFLCDFRGKASELRNGFCSKCGFGEVCAPKVKSLENIQSPNADGLMLSKNVKANVAEEKNDGNDDGDDDDNSDDDGSVCYNEDEEFDVLALRKLVKKERRWASQARAELEKERMAAASAAEEAMAMILRLQNEKSSIEIQANQYRRMAEQKNQYDEAVIQSMQWLVIKHESERDLLEEQLRLCRKKLQHLNGIERGQSEEGDASMNLFNSSIEDGLGDVLDVDPWVL